MFESIIDYLLLGVIQRFCSFKGPLDQVYRGLVFQADAPSPIGFVVGLQALFVATVDKSD